MPAYYLLMHLLKKILRYVILMLIIMLAFLGVGIAGAIFQNKKEQDYDNEIKTELVEGQEGELKENNQE